MVKQPPPAVSEMAFPVLSWSVFFTTEVTDRGETAPPLFRIFDTKWVIHHASKFRAQVLEAKQAHDVVARLAASTLDFDAGGAGLLCFG
jgi:hypothetical protein